MSVYTLNKQTDIQDKQQKISLRDRILTATGKALICCITFFLLTGYTFTDDAPYLIVDCTLGNNIKIYFNTTSADNRLVYDETQQSLINVSNSSIYGYFNRNNEDLRFTFPTFDTPYYTTGYPSQTVYLTGVTIVKNHNVKFYKTFDDQTLMFGCVAALLFFIFLKKG